MRADEPRKRKRKKSRERNRTRTFLESKLPENSSHEGVEFDGNDDMKIKNNHLSRYEIFSMDAC
jgi:hypothetical protein